MSESTPTKPVDSQPDNTYELARFNPFSVGKLGGMTISTEIDKGTFKEKLHSSTIILMEVNEGQKVSLSSLNNFKPIVEAGGKTRAVPENIRSYVSGDYDSDTLNATTHRENWRGRVLEMAERYAFHETDGKLLMQKLGISTLREMTPEQAVKFSTEFVRAVSKYSDQDTKITSQTRADRTACFDLLREGLENRGKPTWNGNGVCRNIAANVKAVFDSLKACQGDNTQLANTYCSIEVGRDGNGYSDKRANPLSTRLVPQPGHAWNIFTTVGENGSAAMTIVDSTWALGSASQEAAANADRTRERAGRIVDQLFSSSTRKEDVFFDVVHYYERLAAVFPSGTSQQKKEQIREFALTQYLAAAKQLPMGVEGAHVPSTFVGVAYRIANKLDPSEISVMYVHDKLNGSLEKQRIGAIVKKAYENPLSGSGQYHIDKFIYRDDDLQEFVYESLGDLALKEMANKSPVFRVRLRELRPNTLEAFDPQMIPKDAEELRYLALITDPNIFDTEPAKIVRSVKRRIERVAETPELAELILVGRSDYDIVKNAPKIMGLLRQSRRTSK